MEQGTVKWFNDAKGFGEAPPFTHRVAKVCPARGLWLLLRRFPRTGDCGWWICVNCRES